MLSSLTVWVISSQRKKVKKPNVKVEDKGVKAEVEGNPSVRPECGMKYLNISVFNENEKSENPSVRH